MLRPNQTCIWFAWYWLYATNCNRYIYTGDVSKLSKTDIDKFVADFKDGNLKKSFRSEPVPERNDGDIKTIVGDNFKDIVGKQDEVLVLFYVPWCKERMAPELAISAIAQDLQAKAPGLVFAKCNSAANEIEGVTISGYPLLKFFKKNSTVSEEYEGDIDISKHNLIQKICLLWFEIIRQSLSQYTMRLS